MTDCKHDWHFLPNTDRLQCRRCKAETGPRTYDQRVQNMLHDVTTMGSAWSKDGKRIDPMSVYAVPTEQLQGYKLHDSRPNYNITFQSSDGRHVGKFDFNGPELVFTGDADESAKVFIDWVAQAFHGRLKEERQAELNACCELLEGMHVATDGSHNYYLWAANELRKLRAGK